MLTRVGNPRHKNQASFMANCAEATTRGYSIVRGLRGFRNAYRHYGKHLVIVFLSRGGNKTPSSTHHRRTFN